MKSLRLWLLLVVLMGSVLVSRPIHAQDGPDLPLVFELDGGITLNLPEGWVIDSTLAPAFALLVSDEAVLTASEPLANEQAIILNVAASFSEGPERSALDAILEYDPEYSLTEDDVTVEATTLAGYPAAISSSVELPIPDSEFVFVLRAAAVRIGTYDLLMIQVAVNSADAAQFEAILNSISIDEAALLEALVVGVRSEVGDTFEHQAIVSRTITGLPGDLAVDVPQNWRVDVREGMVLVGTDVPFLDYLATGTVAQPYERDGAGLNIIPYAVFVFPETLHTPQALMDELQRQVVESGTDTIVFGERREMQVLGGYGLQQPYTSPAGEGVLTILLVDEQFFLQINALVAPGDAELLATLDTILNNLTWVASPPEPAD